MTTKNSLLAVENLRVDFYSRSQEKSFVAVENVSFDIASGEILGLVGESGCGKSLSALTLLDILPQSAVASGFFEFDGEKYRFGSERIAALRGCEIGMVFQEPLTALNPVFSVRDQLYETLAHLLGIKDENELEKESRRLLERVHLDSPREKLDSYPHQLSGGQRQRIMIALALAGEPRLLLADEPTTALDASLQRGIMDLFAELADSGLAVLLISHDLNLVAEAADRVAVMYSGYTVETGGTEQTIKNSLHPYTQGLLISSQAIYSDARRLPVIAGEVPEPSERPPGCPFHPRCPEALDKCRVQFPPLSLTKTGHVSCWARRAEL